MFRPVVFHHLLIFLAAAMNEALTKSVIRKYYAIGIELIEQSITSGSNGLWKKTAPRNTLCVQRQYLQESAEVL